MTVITSNPLAGRPADCSDAEWEARREAAAICNTLAQYRLTDVTNQWHALRLPGEDALLTHHYGWMHEEVPAPNLIKARFDRIDPDLCNDAPNRSATEIGVVFFEAEAEINCIMHIHTKRLDIKGHLEAHEVRQRPVPEIFDVQEGYRRIADIKKSCQGAAQTTT
jgi:ribulose-5-phosphate 4-epimerase/fuculose-1-phosphate aldolase